MKGAVYDGSELLVVDDLEVGGPGPGQVLVRVRAAGLCHSDVSVLTGTIQYPVPVVLGHEGAGVVEEVGVGVTHVAPGDHVVLSTLTNCGACPACATGHPTMCKHTFGSRAQPFLWRGEPAYSFANASVFVERTVVEAVQAVPIPADVPLESASLVGCAVLTGVGAALNRAQVAYGDTALVIGVGGIGLNVIQGCRLAQASRIVAVDANPGKEDLARQFGATDFLTGVAPADLAAAVRELVPDGVDHAFECVGTVPLIEAAVETLAWGGRCVMVGVPPGDARASFLVAGMYLDKSIMGLRYGSSRPHADIPRIIEMYQRGELMLDELVSRARPLEEMAAAVDELEHGTVARSVLTL